MISNGSRAAICRVVLAIVCAGLVGGLSVASAAAPLKPRLIVLTDIGGDPDDQQSMIRLMLYSCDFEIEALVASASGTPGELKQSITQPHLIREIIEAYGKVRPNLLLHRPDYPPAETLLQRVKSGNPQRGQKAIGEGNDTEGSRAIIAVVDAADPRPALMAIWGGQTDLAQALWRVRADRGSEGLKKFCDKLRVHDIADQDGIQPWIFENFPELFYVLDKAAKGRDRRDAAFRGMYLGGDESLTGRAWIDANVRTGHGPLGALYPQKTWTAPNPHGVMKEGDSPSWLYFLANGLGDSEHPDWGGWGGRFAHEKAGLWRDAADTVKDTTDAQATVWRWRPAFQAEFQARLDWSVQPAGKANHAPLAVLDGDDSRHVLIKRAAPGSELELSAAGSSDPDGNELRYRWCFYPEAGSYRGKVALRGEKGSEASLTIPKDGAGKTIHVILEVTDAGTPPLTSFRRAVVEIDR